MNRRLFLSLSATALLDLALSERFGTLYAKKLGPKVYSVVMLGDCHFDTAPASVYHSDYLEDSKLHRAEFARNGEMWRDRCPRMLKRASQLVTPDTRFALQLGDLIQGDCGNGAVHRKMLDDVLSNFKAQLGSLPFVTVVGNHDIRGLDAKEAYRNYMPGRMAQELRKEIAQTTFSFSVGEDAFLVIDFNKPEYELIEQMLRNTEGARHTFIVTHGAVIPNDPNFPHWHLFGGTSAKQIKARLHFRKLFAQREAIVLCGHTHCTELADWYGDGGRITQLCMSSVWSNEKMKFPKVISEGKEQYVEYLKGFMEKYQNKYLKTAVPLLQEYQSGLQRYIRYNAAGSFLMKVSKKHVSVDFYAGDSEAATHTFDLR